MDDDRTRLPWRYARNGRHRLLRAGADLGGRIGGALERPSRAEDDAWSRARTARHRHASAKRTAAGELRGSHQAARHAAAMDVIAGIAARARVRLQRESKHA